MSEGRINDDPLGPSYEGDPKDAEFERALGQFVIAFADAELELRRVLIHYSGVTNPVARALFSGVRAKGIVDFLNSIIENTAMPFDRRSDLEHVFEHLHRIIPMRDHLIHHVSDNYSFDVPGNRIVANARTTRIGKAKGYIVNAKTIRQMTWDLYGIMNSLNMHWSQRTEQFVPWSENHDGVRSPWLYKQLQPIQSWEVSPSDHQGQRVQRKPSRKK